MSITPRQYRSDSFIVGIDTEKVNEVGWSGLNTKSGDLLTIKMKSDSSALMPTTLYTVLHTNNIMEINDTGVRMYD